MINYNNLNYVDNMPTEIFEALLSTNDKALESYTRTNEIMKCVNSHRPSDNRGNTRKMLEKNIVSYCLRNNETLLTTKMVSLSVIFANPVDNPNYFKELCDVFSTEEKGTSKKTIEYGKIASVYGTTVENVKANISLTNFIDKVAELSNKNVQSK